jgi:hypothetical protein
MQRLFLSRNSEDGNGRGQPPQHTLVVTGVMMPEALRRLHGELRRGLRQSEPGAVFPGRGPC